MSFKIMAVGMALAGMAIPLSALEIAVTPGSLAASAPALESTADHTLRLTGSADVRDLSLLRRLSPAVTTLDLSALSVAAYAYPRGGYEGKRAFGANELPPMFIYGSNVEKVSLPVSLSGVGELAFAGSRLVEVAIPAGVSSIGDYAFNAIPTLVKVSLPAASLTGKGIFRNCTLLSDVTVSGSISLVPAETFEGCSSLIYNPLGTATRIGASAFRGTGLTLANLSGVTEVGDYAFAEMPQLAAVRIDAGIPVSFGVGAFYGNPLLADIPEWTGTISSLFAARSGIGSVRTIDVPVIGEAAFANDPKLAALTLGPSVTQICRNAFRNATGLQTVRVDSLGGNIPALDHCAFAGVEDADDRYPVTLYVHDSFVDQWKADPEWSRFNILKASTGLDTPLADVSIDIRKEGARLAVASSRVLDRVEVYTASGLTLYAGAPGTESLEIVVPAAETILVRALAGSAAKVVKLR